MLATKKKITLAMITLLATSSATASQINEIKLFDVQEKITASAVNSNFEYLSSASERAKELYNNKVTYMITQSNQVSVGDSFTGSYDIDITSTVLNCSLVIPANSGIKSHTVNALLPIPDSLSCADVTAELFKTGEHESESMITGEVTTHNSQTYLFSTNIEDSLDYSLSIFGNAGQPDVSFRIDLPVIPELQNLPSSPKTDEEIDKYKAAITNMDAQLYHFDIIEIKEAP